jgi:hypothetical protein
MNEGNKRLGIGRCKYYGFEEQGIWALLLVVAVVQIACAFGARADAAGSGKSEAALVQLDHGTMLAKR